MDVFFQGVKQTLPAVQVIDKILAGQNLVKSGLGNPAKNSTTPDIIVTLKPGYIWVGNPASFNFKNAEHGGFSFDDTHVPLIVSGGAVSDEVRGKFLTQSVQTKQIAVSVLNALGLDTDALQGAVIEGTHALPGLSLEHEHHEAANDSAMPVSPAATLPSQATARRNPPDTTI